MAIKGSLVNGLQAICSEDGKRAEKESFCRSGSSVKTQRETTTTPPPPPDSNSPLPRFPPFLRPIKHSWASLHHVVLAFQQSS
ncbi:hypothetical protein PGT21_010855 [Puccinia graminis f. sp. tritici]|uniref:Uncharacterized protein n=1 Tax=Puccinia graminis f. sp. tritici TaxID=56615 RepID=A0A5B0QF56_PUCGR|nr:hypothetical protein PGT21_010855 [Puccinia graminis f. sp. tritici]